MTQTLAGDEQVDLVDEKDSVIGSSSLGDCISQGLLHRAVAVLVLRGDAKVLLQKRSRADLWQPGLLTLSSTGHVRKGEAYPDAAVRELQEELGIKSPLTYFGKFLLPPMTDGRLTESEWVALFTTKTDAPAVIDRTELEGIVEAPLGELDEIISGEKLTKDAKQLLTQFLQSRLGQT